ncbi:hypothetical protein [Methylomagnum sp.]
MHALKLNANIRPGQRLEVTLPADIPEGEAEVIVLLPEPTTENQAQAEYLARFLEDLEQTHIPRRSKADIDRYIEEERNSWA